MIDFTGVTAIAIPEGAVAKIMRGADVLWEKPSSGGLPAGWALANYVRFTGAQQLDTGIVPTQNTKIEVVFVKESTASIYLYGVRNSGNTASVTAYLASSGAWRFGNAYRNHTLTANKTHTAVVDKTGVVMDGTKGSYGATVKNFTANGTLTVGATRSTAGALGTPQFIGTVSEFRMYSGDTLVLEWLPVYNASSGIYAFFDTVAGEIKQSITATALQGG